MAVETTGTSQSADIGRSAETGQADENTGQSGQSGQAGQVSGNDRSSQAAQAGVTDSSSQASQAGGIDSSSHASHASQASGNDRSSQAAQAGVTDSSSQAAQPGGIDSSSHASQASQPGQAGETSDPDLTSRTSRTSPTSHTDPQTPPRESLATVEAGLDALETTADQDGGALLRVLRAGYPPVLALGLILAVWQALYAAKIWPDWKLPGPHQVFTSLKDAFGNGDVWPAVGHSIGHGAVGFAASVALGTVLGLLVGRFKPVRAGIGPILSGLQSLPSVAWVPPALMFFGPTPAMLYTVVLLGAVPSIAVGVVSGLDQVPPLYLRVGRNIGARGLASVRHVLLPAALPGYLAGLRQGWAFAWRSLLAAEIIVQSADLGHSLGFLLKNAQDTNDMAGAFAAIILILAVGVGVNQLLFVPIERRVLRSRGLA